MSTPENEWAEFEEDDPWLEEDDDDSDEDAPALEEPDDLSETFTWFWGEDEEGGEG